MATAPARPSPPPAARASPPPAAPPAPVAAQPSAVGAPMAQARFVYFYAFK